MLEALKPILEIQELDMQMIQLLRLKKERQGELNNLNVIKEDLARKREEKHETITTLKTSIRLLEGEISEVVAKIKELEDKQSAVKKVDEFNALTQEMSRAEKERIAKEQQSSDLHDQLVAEEDDFKALEENLATTRENSKALEKEILDGIERINEEGRVLKAKRDQLVGGVNSDIFHIYERLLSNKRDRVVVPIENRCCSGCHITVTAQDENLVRKGERIVFCEHCSRIQYWPEGEAIEGTVVATKRRRRRPTKAAS